MVWGAVQITKYRFKFSWHHASSSRNGIQPRVKLLRSSYTGLYPQRDTRQMVSCRANTAHARQPRSYSGLGFQVKVVEKFQVAPAWLFPHSSSLNIPSAFSRSPPPSHTHSLPLAHTLSLPLVPSPSLPLSFSLYLSLSRTLGSGTLTP